MKFKKSKRFLEFYIGDHLRVLHSVDKAFKIELDGDAFFNRHLIEYVYAQGRADERADIYERADELLEKLGV